MVIVFSHIDFFDDEAEMITALFEKGMERFHLKKLGKIEEWRKLLLQLPTEFHKRIVLHTNHDLQKEFKELKLHTNTDQFSDKQYVSSSAHSVAELIVKIDGFDYVFLSPIYTSLSKDKYSPTVDLDIQTINDKSKIVALGGINQKRLMDLKLKGFEHIALLGAVWMEKEKAIANFVKIKKEWESLEKAF